MSPPWVKSRMADETTATATETVIDVGDGVEGFKAAAPSRLEARDGELHRDPLPLADTSAIDEIAALIEDPNSDPADISRKITSQLAQIIKQQWIVRVDNSECNSNRFKANSELIKYLKELRSSLMDTEMLSKRDMLNLDGAKVRLLTDRMVDWFCQALREAGVLEDHKNNIMQQYRDICKAGEPALRREIQQTETGLRRK